MTRTDCRLPIDRPLGREDTRKNGSNRALRQVGSHIPSSMKETLASRRGGHLCSARSAAFHKKWVVVTFHPFGVVPTVSCGHATRGRPAPSWHRTGMRAYSGDGCEVREACIVRRKLQARPLHTASVLSRSCWRSRARPPIGLHSGQRDKVPACGTPRSRCHVALQGCPIGVDRHDGHPRGVFVDVEAVRDQLRLTGADEISRLLDPVLRSSTESSRWNGRYTRSP